MEYFNILKFAQTQTIQGPAVDNLLQTVKMMFGRGAPTQWDDTGFNKIDYGNPLLEELSYKRLGEAIDIKSATTAIGALKKYKARQVPNWDALYMSIQELINASTGFQPTQGTVPENKVTFVKASQYGLIFHIPNIKTKSKNMIYQAISSAPAWQNDRRFNPGDEWKAFSASKNYGMDMYQVNTSFMNEIKAVLDQLGYDTTDFVLPATQPGETPADITEIKATFNPGTGYNKYSITINLQKYDAEVIHLIKLSQRRTYDGATKAWTIYSPELRLVNEILSKCSQPERKFDVTQLQEATNQLSEFLANKSDKETERQTEIEPETEVPVKEQEQSSEQGLVMLKARDVSDETENAWHIGFGFLKKGTREGELLKEILKFSFPIWGEQGQRYVHQGNTWEYRVRGVYQDYITLHRTLTSYGFDTSDYTKTCEALLKKGVLQRGKLIGQLEGFQTTRNGAAVNDYDAFDKALEDNYYGQVEKDGKMIDFKLYDKQKEGIKFLYGRDSALIGDDTGAGKCLGPNSYIQTSYGVYTMQEMWDKFSNDIISYDKNEEWSNTPKDMFVHSVDENEKIIKGKVTKLFRQKYCGTMFTYTTSNGKKIQVSPAHKFLTPTGWKNSLSIGDIVCSSSNQFEIHKTNKTINKELATLIAWQIAEGYDHDNRGTTTITQADIEVLKKLKEIYDNLGFSQSYIRYPKNKKKTTYLEITSVEYKKHIESMGYKWGKRSKDKEIPSCIMNSSKDIVKVFLQSYFDAEGYTSNRSRSIAITSASKKLIYQLSLLLQRFDILVKTREMMKCATNGTKIKRKYHELSICGSGMDKFINEIDFSFYKYKRDSYIQFSEVAHNYNKEGKPAHIPLGKFFNKYNIPFRLIDIPNTYFISGERGSNNETIDRILGGFEKLKNGSILEEYKKLGNSKWTKKTTDVLTSVKENDVNEVVSSLKKMAKNDLQYEEIVKVEEEHYDGYIYDLSVEKYHNYIAENLICHNTIMLSLAADMRMKTVGGRSVIITVSNVREQFMDEIKRFTKSKDEEVSDDIFAGAKWTVMTYSDISQRKKEEVEAILNEINRLGAEKQLQCLILDEIDSVKNDPKNTKRTAAVQSISKSFNSVWGASATIVANRPADVYNQLKAINHPLGNLTLSTFKKEFGGMVPGGWKGAMIDGTIEDQIKAANKLKEWLINYGVYIQRSKKDFREDMPEQEVVKADVDIDEGMLYKNIGQRLRGYKNPELPVSEMIATRTELAISKVERSLEEAQASLEAGEPKVAVFTCFQQSGKPLIDGLQQVLNNTVGGRVGHIMGGMNKKTRLETVKAFKDPNSDMKGLVISIIAGGTGLDFPNVTSKVIVNDFDWTPRSAEQSQGRFFRITSNDDVETKYIIAKGTPDEDFYARVKNKITVANVVRLLTQEQMTLILGGARRGDAKLSDVEKKLGEAVRQQIALEEGEESFENRMHKVINDGIKGVGNTDQITANSNWYRKIKKLG